MIVGAGFGGIAAAIELREHGIEDVTILDRAGGPGGTWHFNTYPGAACDVPSHLYSFSFAQRKDWSRLCSPGPEIVGYVEEVVERFGLRERMVFDTEVGDCAWDEADGRWTVTSTDGRTWEADAVIVATGQLHRPAYPGDPGTRGLHRPRLPLGAVGPRLRPDAASASRSSAPGRAPCSSSPRSPSRRAA